MKTLLNHFTKRPVTKNELNLKNTLLNGQAFNWNQIDEDKFIGVLGNMIIKFQYDEENNV